VSASPLRRPTGAGAAGDAIPFAAPDGSMHLFYLSSPVGPLDYPERVRTTWQHARSRDLVVWEELASAVEPGPVGSYDGDGVWTGSVIEHEGTFYLFYTGHHVGATNPQTICVATSDNLVDFTKASVNPLISPPDWCEPIDWRDPFVFWNAQERRWWMLIAARLAEGPYWRRGCIVLATSNDLVDWEVEDEPLYAPGTTYCPECPEMWEDAQGRWHLVYSRFSEEVGTVSRVGDSPRGPFREPHRPDLGGRRWYAAKSAPWRGERAFFGWIHDRVTMDRTRWLWGGDFALPRIASARPDGSLDVRPVVPQSPAQARATSVDGVGGSAYAILEKEFASGTVEMEIADATARALGFTLLAGESGWRCEILPATGEVRLRREPTPLDDFWADLTDRGSEYREVDGEFVARGRLLDSSSRFSVAIVVDGPLLEIYLADQIALTHRMDSAQSWALSAFSVDGTARISWRTVERSHNAPSSVR
jgi:beta-fructofuranosidase